MLINKTLKNVIDTTCEKLKKSNKPILAKMFSNCFPNTWETTVKVVGERDTFVITGDIPAMWLRDSAAQVNHYLPYAKDDDEIYNVIVGIINRYALYLSKDPYANAYNETDNDHGYSTDITLRSPWVWERKYEVDSLCSVIALPYKLYKHTGKSDFFSKKLKNAFNTILDLWTVEQNHAEKSKYTFFRANTHDELDNMPLQGKGNPTGYTGMTWSGFRPSDDACTYNYLIPSQMYAVVVLGYLQEIFADIYKDTALSEKASALCKQIDGGIKEFGIFKHDKYGDIFKFEVDGLGNYLLMDDANSPSLLSAPYIGYCSANDATYLNTRKFILSSDNPFFYSGTAITGVGSPHTKKGTVWPIALIMQGLTSNDVGEIENILDTLSKTHANTYFMHESIDCNNQEIFTRKWFAWANSLFSELVLKYINLIEMV